MPRKLRFSKLALQDIEALLEYSEAQFGASANKRYAGLIDQAIADLQDQPHRIGVKKIANGRLRDIAHIDSGFHSYHIKNSNRRLPPTQRVGQPRHYIFFIFDDHRLFVARILHDSMDYMQHLTDIL
jgi:toxin ParE1/3/4